MLLNKKLNQNFIYSFLLRVLNTIFPIATFSYVANVLLPNGLGAVEFILSILSIFVVIGQFGTPIYGVKKCSSIQNDKDLLSKTVQELITINFFFSVFIYFIYIFFVITIELYFPKILMVILGTSIIMNSLNIEWLLQALELFKAITIRSFLIKILSFVLILLLVKNSDDSIYYILILFLSSIFEVSFNLVSIIKHVNLFKKYKNYNFSQHFKSLISFFILNFTLLLYLQVDKITLGTLSTDVHVGYYVASNKFIKLVYVFITSFTPVLLPRISYYLNNNLKENALKLLQSSFDFLLFLAIPSSIGLFLVSDLIIKIFFSSSYLPSITTMMILSPLVFFITLSNSIAFLLLIPFGNENKVVVATTLGAILNIFLNIILIPNLNSNGAAISTLISEIFISFILILYSYNLIKKVIVIRKSLILILCSIPFLLITHLVNLLDISNYIKLGLIIVLSIVIFISFSFLFKKLFIDSFAIFKIKL
jgi:O-antigen/teichoic acid export membrane protein